MEFQDRNIECIDCHASFVFTAGEQEFYERKGFKEIPKRCKDCRDKRKARRDGGGGSERGYGGGGGGGYGGGGSYSSGGYGSGGGYGDDIGNRAAGPPQRNGGSSGGGSGGGSGAGGANSNQREFFDAVCAACGAAARVPFRPAAGRPVYCRDCYANRSSGGY